MVRANFTGVATRSLLAELETCPEPGLLSLVGSSAADLLAVALFFDAVERAA